MESKKLFLSVHFDKNARNFSIEHVTIVWNPTYDELDFIVEICELIEGIKYSGKVIEKTQTTITSSEVEAFDYSHNSSEIQVTPTENDKTIEVTADLGSSDITNKENDEKKIDEILNRKK